MTADIVNLRKARKARDRAEKDAKASENRIRFGRSKADRQAGDAQSRLEAVRLEGHRLTRTDGADGDGA